VFQIKDGAYNTDSFIEFLGELHGHFADEKITWHDLNPVELVWGNVKAVELANLSPTPSRRRRLQPRPAWNGSAPATNCASTSSTTPGFLYDRILMIMVLPKHLGPHLPNRDLTLLFRPLWIR
jgi:hypothetical protein